MKNLCTTILQAADTGTKTSSQIDANQLVSASFMAIFGDASAAGTLKIQASNDPTNLTGAPVPPTITNWVDIPSATATVTAGASVIITLPNLCYRWLRAVYTASNAGTTTITVNINALSV